MMTRNRITKKECSLYFKLNGDYCYFGDGYLVSLGQEECLIVFQSLIENHNTVYAKLEADYFPFNPSDWTLLLDIAIVKINRVKKTKQKKTNKTDDNFTEDDFQNALKKVSRKVMTKKEKNK